MYSSLSIKNLRGLESLELAELQRINIFVGRNNTGKSTVLEGLFLLGSATNGTAALSVAQQRDQYTLQPDRLWRPLFGNAEPGQPIAIDGRWKNWNRRLNIAAIKADPVTASADAKASQSIRVTTVSDNFIIGGLTLTYINADNVSSQGTITINPITHVVNTSGQQTPNTDIIPTAFLSARGWPSIPEVARQFSALVKIKQEDSVVEALKSLDPRITRLEVLSDGGSAAVYADTGFEALLPLAVAGEGLMRLFVMAVTFADIRGGVLLVDEIDNGLHHSVMDDVWRFLAKQAARFDVQIFATTHSDEMIRSALHTCERERTPAGLFRLDVRNGRHEVASYDDESIKAVLDTGFDPRS